MNFVKFSQGNVFENASFTHLKTVNFACRGIFSILTSANFIRVKEAF
ncbi:MAG: hypothetical protein V5804_13245 [Mucilaginibacter sp.]